LAHSSLPNVIGTYEENFPPTVINDIRADHARLLDRPAYPPGP